MAPQAYPSSDSSGDHDRAGTPKTPVEMNAPAWSMSVPTADLIALIPKLKGPSNFEEWEKSFKAVCKVCGLWQLASANQPEPTKPASTDADALADYLQKLTLYRRATDALEGLIMLTIEHGPYSYVEQFGGTPSKMFNRLLDLYSPERSDERYAAAAFRAEKRAMGLKATDFASAVDYANAMQALLNKLSIGQEHMPFYIHSFLTGLKGTRYHSELYEYYERRRCTEGPRTNVEFHEIVRKLVDIEEVFQDPARPMDVSATEDRNANGGTSNGMGAKQQQRQQRDLVTHPKLHTDETINGQTSTKLQQRFEAVKKEVVTTEVVKQEVRALDLSKSSQSSTPASKKQQKFGKETHQPIELMPVVSIKKPHTIQSASAKVPVVSITEPTTQSEVGQPANMATPESSGGNDRTSPLTMDFQRGYLVHDPISEQIELKYRPLSLSDPETELEVDTMKALVSDVDDSSNQSTAASELEVEPQHLVKDLPAGQVELISDDPTAEKSGKEEASESNTEILLPHLEELAAAPTTESVTSPGSLSTTDISNGKWSGEQVSLIDEDQPIGDNDQEAEGAGGKWMSPTVVKQRQRLNSAQSEDPDRQHDRKDSYDISESRGNGSLYICDYCGGMGHEVRFCWFKHPDLAKNARWISDNADRINELGQRRSKTKGKLALLQAKRQSSAKESVAGRSSSLSGEVDVKKLRGLKTACSYCEELSHEEESCWFKNPTLAPFRWQMVCAKKVAELRKKHMAVLANSEKKAEEKKAEEKKEERYVVGLSTDTW